MGNIGKALKRAASGFETGYRIGLMRENQAKEKLLEASKLVILKKQNEIEESRVKNKSKELAFKALGLVVTQDGIDPNRKDAITENFKKEYGMDISPFWIPNKNEKTGVVESYHLEDKDVWMKKIDDENADLDREVEKTKNYINAIDKEIELRKLKRGDPKKTFEHAILDKLYNDPKFKNSSPEEQRNMIVKEALRLPTPSTQIPIEKTTKGKIETDMYSALLQMEDTKTIAKNYASDMLTYEGKIKRFALSTLTKAKIDINDKNKKFLQSATLFKNALNRLFNRYIKDITGAQFSVKEMDRYKDSFINTEMDPISFEAEFKRFNSFLLRSYRTRNYIIENGLADFGTKEYENLLKNNLNSIGDITLSKENRYKRADELYNKIKVENKNLDEDKINMLVKNRMETEGYY